MMDHANAVRRFSPHAGAPSEAIEFEALHLLPWHRFFDVELRIDPTDASYEHSKFYFATAPHQPFDESRVICFRVLHRGQPETVRLEMPASAIACKYLRLRLVALPLGAGEIVCERVTLTDGEHGSALTRAALLQAQKQRVRADVVHSEASGRAILPHYPESLSLELTAACNLTCSHCSSHGEPGEHRRNNLRRAFDEAMLEKLAHEVFAHLTMVTLVGRGEPMMVKAQIWDTLTRLLREYGVFLSCVTNGYFIRERISAAVMEIIDIIIVSIDGLTPDIFAENRGGADLARVLANVAYYNDLRRALPLARRPRLGFSWTLKRNNIAQFPDFVRAIMRYDPSLLYVRHLFTFRDKDNPQSLLGEAQLVNPILREAYALLEGRNIQMDVPPLMAED